MRAEGISIRVPARRGRFKDRWEQVRVFSGPKRDPKKPEPGLKMHFFYEFK